MQGVRWAQVKSLSDPPAPFGAGTVRANSRRPFFFPWDVLRWVYDNRQRLLALGTAVVEGFKTLLGDGGEDAVADLVEHGLAQAFVPALDLIAKQFDLDVIPQKIREVVGELVGIVPNEVKDLLLKLKAWIWDKIKALVGGLFGKTRWVVHGREHELWIDYNEGQVLTSGSPTVSARDELTRLEELAKKAEDATALGLIAKARTLVASMEKLIVQAKEEAAAAPAAKGKEGEPAPKAAKKKTGAQAALDKDTGPLAAMLKEIQERVEGARAGRGALKAGMPGAGAGAAAAAKCLVGATRPLLQRGLGAPIAEVRPGWALAWRPGARRGRGRTAPGCVWCVWSWTTGTGPGWRPTCCVPRAGSRRWRGAWCGWRCRRWGRWAGRGCGRSSRARSWKRDRGR